MLARLYKTGREMRNVIVSGDPNVSSPFSLRVMARLYHDLFSKYIFI